MNSIDETDEDIAAILGVTTTTAVQKDQKLRAFALTTLAPSAIAVGATLFVLTAVRLMSPFQPEASPIALQKPEVSPRTYASVAIAPPAATSTGVIAAGPAPAARILADARGSKAGKTTARLRLRTARSSTRFAINGVQADKRAAARADRPLEFASMTPAAAQSSLPPVVEKARPDAPALVAFLAPNFAETKAGRNERIAASDALRILRQR